MPDIEIIVTLDGSHSLRNHALDETYHSVHGAIQESVHVFIKNGLEFLQSQNRLRRINILEVGFGTGLNAFLTLKHALGSTDQFHYTSLETEPLGEEVVRQLNYAQILGGEGATSLFQKLHTASWTQPAQVTNNFELKKELGRIQDSELGERQFDVVYFDAFAPSKQPELWTASVLKKVEQSMKPGGVFVTYCAMGQLKRDLRSLGLEVQTLPGPPGKKEMVRALKS